MHKDILKFLNKYNSDVNLLNKLFVSLFIKANKIKVNHNRLIKELIISENNIEQELFKEFRFLFERYENNINFGKLIQLFEHSIPFQDRVINGIVYTPKYIKLYIVDEIMNRLHSPISQAKFCDLSCGCGGFLYTIAKKIKNINEKKYNEIFKNYLYGLDIKDYSIERAQILLSLLAISEDEDKSDFEFNLYVGNALNFDWFERVPFINQNKGFDAIVGNPPYVTIRNINEESKKLLKTWSVTRGGNTDLYIPFFEIGINYLKQNGILGYITVNTFFRSLNARALRKYFHDNSFNLKIIDFGNERVFGNKSAYTCLCFIQKQVSDRIKYTKANIDQIQKNKALEFKEISYKSLDDSRGWLLCSNSILEKLKMIEAIGVPLINRFKMRTGLATLSNNVFIFKPFKEDDNFYFIKKSDNLFPIEKNVCKDIINPNKIKSDLDIPKQLEKIIFPYHKCKNRVELFNEDYFKTNFSYAYKYLEIYKKILDKRDKGNGKYQNWFAFGRTQSLSDTGFKLLFPHITTQPRFIFADYPELLFYNGHAFYSDSKKELLILKLILESEVFEFYISHSSKPYTNGYFSLSKNYIKYFSIVDLTPNEKDYLLNCRGKKEINSFLQEKYTNI